MKTKAKRNKKNCLPGTPASQKSVAEFFKVVNTGITISTPIPEPKNEKMLDKEYRLARNKLPWRDRVNILCVYSEQGVSCVDEVRTPNDMSSTGREMQEVLEVESIYNTNKKCQKGGKGKANLNSELLRGVVASNLDKGGVVGQSQRKNGKK